MGFLNNIEDFSLIEDAAEAVKLINQSGYLAIVVTNQPEQGISFPKFSPK